MEIKERMLGRGTNDSVLQTWTWSFGRTAGETLSQASSVLASGHSHEAMRYYEIVLGGLLIWTFYNSKKQTNKQKNTTPQQNTTECKVSASDILYYDNAVQNSSWSSRDIVGQAQCQSKHLSGCFFFLPLARAALDLTINLTLKIYSVFWSFLNGGHC